MKSVVVGGLFSNGAGIAVINRYCALAKSLMCNGITPVFVSNIFPVGLESAVGEANENFSRHVLFPKMWDKFIGTRLQHRLFEFGFYWALLRSKFDTHVSAIIIPMSRLTFRLLIINSLTLRLPIIVDCMEWHEAKQFRYRWLSPAFWRFLWKFHVVVLHTDGVLAISNYLARHFRSRGMKVLRLLPQVDAAEFDEHLGPTDCGCVHIFYAGTPHKKDYLGMVLRALSELTPKERTCIKFTVAGVALPELKKLAEEAVADWDSVEPQLRILGRITRTQVLKELSKADFLILLRQSSRYSEAGFPSKVSESLAAGTPIITNLTSDLGEFLVDDKNAILVNCFDIEGVATALRKALKMDRKLIEAMSSQARFTAITNFDYHIHASDLKSFIQEISIDKRHS